MEGSIQETEIRMRNAIEWPATISHQVFFPDGALSSLSRFLIEVTPSGRWQGRIAGPSRGRFFQSAYGLKNHCNWRSACTKTGVGNTPIFRRTKS